MRPVAKFHQYRDEDYDLVLNNLKKLMTDFKRGKVIGMAVVELRADGRNQDWHGHRKEDHKVGRADVYRYLAGCELLKDKFSRMCHPKDE